MGIQPSKTELFLPSDTLRKCDPDRCWCDRPSHGRSRYVYVEREGDGKERFHDPVDMMNNFMTGGMSPSAMPWKDPRSWTVRDYERLGEILEEYQNRERGRRMGAGHGPPPPNYGGGAYGGWPMPPGPYDDHRPHRRSHRHHPSRSEFERMQEDIDDKFRSMWENYSQHLAERDAIFFGTDADRRKDQYRNNMVKTMQELMPQLQQMWAMQNMYGGGGGGGMVPPWTMGAGSGPRMNPGMPQPQPQPPMYDGGGMPMPMPGVNMRGTQPGGMNHTMPNPMMPGTHEMNVNMSPGYPRRPKRPRPGVRGAFVEDDDADLRWTGRPFQQGRPWDSDIRGGFGDGTHLPRNPFSGGPPFRPRPRPGGGLDGSGGMTFDDEDVYQPVGPRLSRYRSGVTTPPLDSPRPLFRANPIVAEPLFGPSSPLAETEMHTQETATPPEYDRTAAFDSMDPGAYYQQRATYLRSQSFDPTMARRHSEYLGQQGLDATFARGMRTPYPSGVTGPYASGAMPYRTGATTAGADRGEGPSMRSGMGGQRVNFKPEAGLARSRNEEAALGESEAGAPPSKKDGL